MSHSVLNLTKMTMVCKEKLMRLSFTHHCNIFLVLVEIRKGNKLATRLAVSNGFL